MTQRVAGRAMWRAGTWIMAGLVAAPVFAVAANLLVPRGEVWAHLADTILWELTGNTIALLAGVGATTTALGTTLAWLVVAHRFPGRGFFEWALALPLAVPAYVLGFVAIALLEVAGPVQTTLRAAAGPEFRLPVDIRSGWGAGLVLSLALYPYPYLLARTAFRSLGASPLEAARSLGATRREAFWRVVLPLARPAIAAGVLLALMEALADFGTVALFDFRTYTVGIYRVWFGLFDRVAAGQLAVVLLAWALGLQLLERALRGRQRYVQSHGRAAAAVRPRLPGWRAWGASLLCLTIFAAGFAIPVGVLASWAWSPVLGRTRPLAPVAVNTLLLAAAATLVCVATGLTLAYGRRLLPSPGLRLATRIAALGYALPGSVVAVGIILVVATLDHAGSDLLARLTGTEMPLVLTMTAVPLLFAYVVRFLALALHPVDAGLMRINRNLDESAASLGATPLQTVLRIHGPLLRGPLLAAALLVFVDVMKELPATMLIRPRGWDTLAVEVWQLTTEALWRDAAVPALAIVAAGIPVVVALVRFGGRMLGEEAA